MLPRRTLPQPEEKRQPDVSAADRPTHQSALGDPGFGRPKQRRDQPGARLLLAKARATVRVSRGRANARQAVGALRRDALPTLAQLPALIDSYKADSNLDVALRIEGAAQTLPADRSLALYRGAQEALTNVARYAPSACTTVAVRYEHDHTTLWVDNRASDAPPRPGIGGGHGLQGLRERIERAGGTMSAGPTTDGWRVEIEVPR